MTYNPRELEEGTLEVSRADIYWTNQRRVESELTLVFQVRKYVVRREVTPKKEGGKPYTKAPKIQRLVTPQRLQHKRRRLALKRRQSERVKDAAVCLLSSYLGDHALTKYRTNTPNSLPSVFPKPRPPRQRSARDGPAR